MSHYEVVISRCKRLEHLLKEGFGATGRGLHEKTTSVAKKLPPPLVKKLRFIATVRNKLVHESPGNRVDDLSGYETACDEAEAQIKQLTQPAKTGCAAMILLLAVGLLSVLGAVAWLVV